jgi:putative flippase GtrA
MFRRLLKNQTTSARVQFFRYSITAGVSSLIDLLILWYMTDFLQIYFIISAIVAYIIGTLINYLFSSIWVFNKNTQDSVINEFAVADFGVFILIGGVGLVFLSSLMWVFTAIWRFHYLISKLLASIITYFWNFFGRRRFIYARKFA